MYDWANSAFATTVMAGFFPLFFKKYWSTGVDVTESSLKLGIANSIGSIIVAVLAPVMGAIADIGGVKRRFLILFTFLGAAMTIGLYTVAQGNWQMAVLFYALASVGFSGGISINDSQIVDVTSPEKYNAVSALGYGLGYLGGGLLFAINVWMTLQPAFFGFADAADAVKFSFLMVGAWWLIFSIPIMLYVKDTNIVSDQSYSQIIKQGIGQLVGTFHEISKRKVIITFLAAYWFYIDGVNTVIKMAVDYGMSLGFDTNILITALLVVQFVGFPAAILFGKIGNRFGAKAGILIALVIYIGVTIYGYFMSTSTDFYVLAIVIGLVQGGVQSLSRSVFASLIPENQAGEYFGFFNMLGKFAAIIGPTLMGVVAYWTGSTRTSILALIVLFAIGGSILLRVKIEDHKVPASA
jgi:UMF1 family MFS transporter